MIDRTCGTVLNMTLSPTEETRVCPDCFKRKPLSEWSRSKSRAGGYGSYCRACALARVAIAQRKKRYGITQEEFLAMLEAQDHKCAICRREITFGGGRISGKQKDQNSGSVDHCHDSNKVRGLLCNGCNVGLGYFEDNPDTLRAAIDYLARNVVRS